MRDLIRKILKEETNKNFTNLIQRLMDRNIVSKYPDDVCKIEVDGRTENVLYPRYWVSVIFKVSDNHLTDRDLAKNIWMTFGRLSIDILKFHLSCVRHLSVTVRKTLQIYSKAK